MANSIKDHAAQLSLAQIKRSDLDQQTKLIFMKQARSIMIDTRKDEEASSLKSSIIDTYRNLIATSEDTEKLDHLTCLLDLLDPSDTEYLTYLDMAEKLVRNRIEQLIPLVEDEKKYGYGTKSVEQSGCYLRLAQLYPNDGEKLISFLLSAFDCSDTPPFVQFGFPKFANHAEIHNFHI